MNAALILAGGIGNRMEENVPKQYIEVCGKPVFSYCFDNLFQHKMIDTVQIVSAPEWQNTIKMWLPKDESCKKFRGFSKPGENRQLSILQGIEDILRYAKGTDYVLIHDAVRPFLSADLISACLSAVVGHDGVVPVLPMKDTVYVSGDGKTISSLLNRSEIFAGQAPEVFRLGKYCEANRHLLPDQILSINGATEPAVLGKMDIVMIPGDENNFKITTQADLKRFCELIAGNER